MMRAQYMIKMMIRASSMNEKWYMIGTHNDMIIIVNDAINN